MIQGTPMQPMQQMQQMQVVVPPGVAPGGMFVIQTPDGQQMQVQAQVGAGQQMVVQVPAAPVQAMAQAMAQPMAAPMLQPMMAAPQPQVMSYANSGIVMGVAVSSAMGAQALQLAPQDQVPLLDPITAGILASTTSFQVRQRVKFWETASGGCCEQPNTYDFFDVSTGAHVFIAQEESDDLMRCCCAPFHTVRVHFKLVNQTERQWGSKGSIQGMPTVMTLDRIGACDKMLCCCAFADSCKGVRSHGAAGVRTSASIARSAAAETATNAPAASLVPW